jgi:hypothetical protein
MPQWLTGDAKARGDPLSMNNIASRFLTYSLLLVFTSSCYEKAEPRPVYRGNVQTANGGDAVQTAANSDAMDPNAPPADPNAPVPDPSQPAAGNTQPPKPPTGTTPSSPLANPATGSTSIAFTPTTYAGANYPAFVYAVWITDSTNKYVKTVKAQAASRMRYLDKWLTSAGVTLPTQPDGVTGATLSFNGAAPVAINWDMKDKAGAFVAQGNYNINIQMTSSNNTGLSLVIPVTINAAGMMKNDATMTAGITAVTVKHTP